MVAGSRQWRLFFYTQIIDYRIMIRYSEFFPQCFAIDIFKEFYICGFLTYAFICWFVPPLLGMVTGFQSRQTHKKCK